MSKYGSIAPRVKQTHLNGNMTLRVISRPLAALISHRGVTHSVLAVLACLVLLRWERFSNSRLSDSPEDMTVMEM